MEVLTTHGFIDFSSNLRVDDLNLDLFTVLGSGVSRTVYALSDLYVLKVDRVEGGSDWAGGNEAEWDFFTSLDEDMRTHVAKIYAHADDFRWMISERVAGTAYDLGIDSGFYHVRQILEDAGCGDLHEGNMGQREDGTWVGIDTAFIGGVKMGGNGCSCGCEGSPMISECECFECDCGRCFPDGCGCETFEGCRRTICSLCVDRRQSLRRIVDAHRVKRGSLLACSPDRWGRHGMVTLPTLALARIVDALKEDAGTAITREHIGPDAQTYKICADCRDDVRGAPVYGNPQPNLWGDAHHGMADLGRECVNYWHGPRDVLVKFDCAWNPKMHGPKIVRPIYFARLNMRHGANMVCFVNDDRGWHIVSFMVADLRMFAPIFGEM